MLWASSLGLTYHVPATFVERSDRSVELLHGHGHLGVVRAFADGRSRRWSDQALGFQLLI